MLRWMLAPVAAPIGGLVVGVAVFVGVLFATSPGLPSPYWMVVAPTRNPIGASAAYATGAASTLGLLAMAVVAGVLAAARKIWLAARARQRPAD